MKSKKMKSKGKLINPAKRSIHVKGKWKSIELDPNLFSDEGMEGLVCFEELTSYRLVDPEKAAAQAAKEQKKLKKKKDLKRKAREEITDGNEAGESTGETPKKKAKKKKSQVKKFVDQFNESAELVAQTDEIVIDIDTKTETIEETAACSEQLSKPGKKKNKKMKKKHITETTSVTAEQPKQEATSEDQPIEVDKSLNNKPSKVPKKQVKNWTDAALSGSKDTNTDMSAWKNLFVPAPVLKALCSLGFSSPTPIQALALPPAIRDRMDILGAAETGSGKTLAFGIPMIHMILEWRQNPDKSAEGDAKKVESLYLQNEPTDEDAEKEGSSEQDPDHTAVENPVDDDMDDIDEEDGDEDGADDIKLGCMQVGEKTTLDSVLEADQEDAASKAQPLLGLVLTPTRELAVQVKHHIDAIAKFTNIKTAIVVGGMSQQKQRRMLKRRPEIIIATPGRLWDIINEKHPHLQNLRQLRCLVIDEADRMVERGHFAELESILEMLHTFNYNPSRQMFIFSATLTMSYSLPTRVLQKKKNLDQRSKLEVLMEKVGIKTKPKVIDLTRKEATVETLTETRIHCQKEEKDYFLYYFLLQHPGRTMVFANSIDCIKRLNSLLLIMDCTPLPLHANMHQKQRLKNLERFAERESCVLLTTDVAARGLDIPNVQHVIHYQVPRTSETYVHRSGRTARATKEGLSLLLIGPDDMMNFKKIYRTLGKDEDLPMFPIETKCMAAIKERVDLARKIEKIEYHNCKEKQHNSWLRQAAEALDVEVDDELLLGKSGDAEADVQQQRMVKGMKKQLQHLISQPVFKYVMKTKYPTQMGTLALRQAALAGTESALTRVSMQEKEHKAKKKITDKRKQRKQK